MSTEDTDKVAYDVDEAVAAPPTEKKVPGLGTVAFVGPRAKAKAKQQKNYGHIASAEDHIEALKKIGIEAKPDDWVVYFPESRMKSIDEMLSKLQKDEAFAGTGYKATPEQDKASKEFEKKGYKFVQWIAPEYSTGKEERGEMMLRKGKDVVIIGPDGDLGESSKSVDEMLAKLHAEADAPAASKQNKLTYQQARALHAEVSDDESDELLKKIDDIEKAIEENRLKVQNLLRTEDHLEEVLDETIEDFIRVMKDITADLDPAVKDQYIEASGKNVDEAKIAIPQAIEDITVALDALASAEGPDKAINALRDIISTVAGALDKLGNKSAAKALAKVAMETEPSAAEPAVTTARESTTFANI